MADFTFLGHHLPSTGEAALLFGWHRGLTIRATYTPQAHHGWPASLVNLRSMGTSVEVVGTYLNTIYGDGVHRAEYEGQVSSLVWGAGPVQHIRFDIGNFPETVRSTQDPPWEGQVSRTSLHSDGWGIVIDEVPGARKVRKEVKRWGGGGVTHTAILARADGAPFDPTTGEVADLLHATQWMLSFAAAAWVPILVPTGIAPDGTIRWGKWGSPRTSTLNALRWMSTHRAGALSQLWPGWWRSWRSDHAHDVLRLSIPMYVDAALAKGGVELGLTSAFTALEVVAWHRLAERPGANYSRRRTNEMTAEARLRTMLQEIDVPTDVPSTLGAAMQGLSLVGRPRSGARADGPFLLSTLRNRITHPRNTERIRSIPLPVKFATWQLALWYFELAVLHLCRFEGEYLPRSLRPTTEFAVRKPPWVETET